MSLAIPLPQQLVDEIARKVADLISDQHAPAPDYLTPAEAADYLRCKPQRIYDLTSQGRLRARKDGSRSLFKRSDLDAYLAGEASR
jgi:excisionase family DNA binding protein